MNSGCRAGVGPHTRLALANLPKTAANHSTSFATISSLARLYGPFDRSTYNVQRLVESTYFLPMGVITTKTSLQPGPNQLTFCSLGRGSDARTSHGSQIFYCIFDCNCQPSRGFVPTEVNIHRCHPYIIFMPAIP